LKRGSKKLVWIGSFLVLILLGVTGFYGVFWKYITRGGAFDPTLTGRTVTWQEAWKLFEESPLLGLGFHADRIYLSYLEYGQHTHNALLHALIQTGVLGTLPLLAALVIAWILVLRIYRGRAFSGQYSLPLEVPCVLAFVTASSITESTFALYNVYWLMIAPCFAYLQVAHQQRAVELRHAVREHSRLPFVRPGFALPKATPRGG
jgi:O-antigen ligase